VTGDGYYDVLSNCALNRKDWRRTVSDETTRFSEHPAHHINTDDILDSVIDSILISAKTTCLLAVRTIND
jgi:hypothetical protein